MGSEVLPLKGDANDIGTEANFARPGDESGTKISAP